MCLKTDLRSRPDSLIIRDTPGRRARGAAGAASRDTRAAGSGGLQCYGNLIRLTYHATLHDLTALIHWREDLDVAQVEEGRTLEVRAYVENKAAQASASWLSGGPFQG